MNYFEMLGVSESSSDDEVLAAHQRLAQRFHPDQHPEAPESERAAWRAAMLSIDQAAVALRTAAGRAHYATWLRTQQQGDVPPSVPPSNVCEFCGSQPASRFEFQHQHAYIFWARTYTVNAVLCRCCALAMGRGKQNRTLLAGWWGVLSFFRNLLVITGNVSGLRRAAKLPAPTAPAGPGPAPLRAPLNPGRSVFGRLGFWFFVAVAAVVALVGATAEDGGFESTNSGGAATGWKVGACVAGETFATPVSCGGAHTGRIVDKVTSMADCPRSSEGWVEDGLVVWCVDEDA